MNEKISISGLFLTTLLTGFYAGTGFFILMGGNPAIAKMSSNTFAEYWQHTDFYMAARMKIFGPVLLFTVLTTLLLHIGQWKTASFWFLSMALFILITDMIYVFTVHFPLNQLIQSWDLHHLPSDVQQIKQKVTDAFRIRSVCMIGSFVCVLLALFLKKK